LNREAGLPRPGRLQGIDFLAVLDYHWLHGYWTIDMELTPQERERIYLEEKARLEIRQQLESASAAATASIPVTTRPSNGVAAVLSLFIPGAGQMYKGRVGQGFVWLIGTVIGYFMMVFPGVIIHVICIFHAFSIEPTASS